MRKISWRNVLLAFSLATLVFLSGVIIGNRISGEKYDRFQLMLAELRIQTISTETQFNILAENPCKSPDESFLSSELSSLTAKLDSLEKLYGRNDPEVINLKEYYAILQMQHWLLYKKTKAQCNLSYDLILYFYSNKENRCNTCGIQGDVLTAFRKKYENIKVYSFDSDLTSPAIKTLLKIYGIESTPTTVYNDHVLKGYVDMAKLEELKAAQGNLTQPKS